MKWVKTSRALPTVFYETLLVRVLNPYRTDSYYYYTLAQYFNGTWHTLGNLDIFEDRTGEIITHWCYIEDPTIGELSK